MAFNRKRMSASHSRRVSGQLDRSVVGTHVKRKVQPDTRRIDNARSVSFSNRRASAHASRSQVDYLVPDTSSGESSRAHRRRTGSGQYMHTVKRKAALRRVLAALVAVAVVAGVAVGAGFLAFRGTVGSGLALRDSNAADALVQVRSDEPYYALITAELGAVAQSLDHDGPDVILLARVDRDQQKLALVNIPASLKTVVDNDTRRLGAMALAGDAALISAVQSFAKVDISHYVKIEEGGVAGIVDALGGIDVDIEQVIDDPQAGDVYYPQGTYTLNGAGALTYLRATNLRLGEQDQYDHQVKFASLVISKLFSGSGGVTANLEAVAPYIQTDLSLSDIEALGKWMGAPSDGIVCDVLPGFTTAASDVVDGAEPLYVATSDDLAKVLDALANGTTYEEAEKPQVTSTVDPESFTIEVQNGTDIVGAANTTANALAQMGFAIDHAGNAEQQVYNETLVVYRTSATKGSGEKSGLEQIYDQAGQQGQQAEEEWYDEETDDGGSQGTSDKKAAEQAAKAEEQQIALGKARADAVIQALGIGRAVEGDMYYSFDADILVIIGYDYKPVA